MHPPIPTGLLAYGTSGRLFHAPFLAAHPGFALRAVVERHRQHAALDYPGARSYPSAEALLADPALELVVVNTPNATHFELARQALEAGKHVLLEKPLAVTAAEGRALYALARQGRQLLPYQNRRWDSDFQLVRQVVAGGQLGRLVEAHFRFDRYKPGLNAKAHKETPTPGNGLLYDLGPHLLDQVLSLFGPPARVHKTVGRARPGSQVDDFFALQLRYTAPGAPQLVTVAGSLLVAQPGPAYVLHGTAGSFAKPRGDVQETQLQQGLSPRADAYGRETDATAGTLALADAAGSRPPQRLAAPPGNYLGLFEAAYQTLRHGAPYPVAEADALAQLELLERPADAGP